METHEICFAVYNGRSHMLWSISQPANLTAEFVTKYKNICSSILLGLTQDAVITLCCFKQKRNTSEPIRMSVGIESILLFVVEFLDVGGER